jgi:hypothetical protein
LHHIRAVARIFHGGSQILIFSFTVRRAAWQDNGFSKILLTFWGRTPKIFEN